MADIALPGSVEPARRGPISGIFGGVIAAALLFVAYSVHTDVDAGALYFVFWHVF
jgi:inorganic phosphate transporter, PiT family